MRRRGRHLDSRRSELRGLLALAIAAALVVVHPMGVGQAFWVAQIPMSGTVATGSLEVGLTGLEEDLVFDCQAIPFSEDPISFIRFWDPSQPPGELVSAGTGAVKIEEDRLEIGSGNYWVDPHLTQLGDLGPDGSSVVVNLDGVEVQIIDWVEHPDLAGRFVGFYYATEGTELVIDVKAGQNLWRATLAGSGLWWPEDLEPDDMLVVVLCDTFSRSSDMVVQNTGSIPARAFLEFARAPSDDEDDCELFDVLLTLNETGEAVYEGPLCGLIGSRFDITDQLDPAEEIALKIEVSVRDPLPYGEQVLDYSEELVAEATFVQWMSGPPGDPDFYGWMAKDSADLVLSLSIDPLPTIDSSDAEEPPGEDPPVEEPPGEEEPPPEEPPVEDPPVEDPPVEEPPGEEEPPLEEPPVEDPPVVEPPVEEPSVSVLAGHVWEDTDGDWVAVRGGSETGVTQVTVVLYDESMHEIARVETDDEGNYVFSDLTPGAYIVEFLAPEGYGFADAAESLPDDLDAWVLELADRYGVAVDDIVVGDLDDYGYVKKTRTWSGQTQALTIDAGGNDGLADAPLTVLPDPPGKGHGRVKSLDSMLTKPDEPAPVEGEQTP